MNSVPGTLDDRELSVVLDLDLGELVEGHRVFARHIARDGPAELHYVFVPGLDLETSEPDRRPPFFWYWTLRARDELGTDYLDANTGSVSGAGGASSSGRRDLGGRIPADARQLTIDFAPAPGWSPSGSYVRRVVVDLVSRSVIEVVHSA